MVVLDVDDARGDISPSRGDLAKEVDLRHLAVRELEHELIDPEREHRVEDRPIRPPRERPAEVVPEAEVRAEPHPTDDRLDGGVEQRREVRWRIGVDGRRRVVDLDVVGALGDQALQLGTQDRYEGFRGSVARLVDLAVAGPQSAGQRVRSGQRHLQRPSRARAREAELLDDAESVRRGDRLEDLEPMLLVVPADAEPPVCDERAQSADVLVELRGEEAGTAHLAVGHEVDPGVLLVAQREIDGVVQHLREVRGTELTAFGGVDPRHEPRRPGVRPDHAGAEGVGHGVVPRSVGANAKIRAGLSTNRRRRTSAPRPRSSIC